MQQNLNTEYIVRKLFVVRIYALTDLNGNVFYVGATTDSLKTRLRNHIHSAEPFHQFARSPRATKIRELDYQINIIELDSAGCFGVDKREAQISAINIEMKWINKYLNEGYNLTNRRISC